MTREEARENARVMLAYAEGKVIQVLHGQNWDDEEPVFNFFNNKYRIKPTPTYRPWLPSEVPVGAWIRSKGKTWVCLIVGCNETDISTPVFNSGHDCYKYGHAVTHYEYSTDKGKTWQPCGVAIHEDQD